MRHDSERDAVIYQKRLAGSKLLEMAAEHGITKQRIHQICKREQRRGLEGDCLSERARGFLERMRGKGYDTYLDVPRHKVLFARQVGLKTYNELEGRYRGARPVNTREFYLIAAKECRV